MNSWKEMMVEGRKYLTTVSKAAGSKKFTPVLLYNLSTIALEKYVMATCMINNYLPENHTLTDLIYAVQRFVPIDTALQNSILQYENVQQLCSMEDYQRHDISPEDLEKFMESVITFCNILYNYCKEVENVGSPISD